LTSTDGVTRASDDLCKRSTEDSVRSVRPGFGLAPKYLDEIIGKKARKDINKNTAVSNDSFL